MPDANGYPVEDRDIPVAPPQVKKPKPSPIPIKVNINERKYIAPVLSIVTTIGVFSLFAYLTSERCTAPKEVTFYILGSATSALMTILNFYFGSSQGSQAKDKTIADMASQQRYEEYRRLEVEQ
jgi:hypothetical protein